MKVEIDFPVDFESRERCPIPIGRIYIGPFAVRIIFCHDGNTRIVIDQEAIRQGFVHVGCVPEPSPQVGFGIAQLKREEG